MDWTLWLHFWTSTTGNLGLLHIPLTKWLYPSHRTWQWYYCKYNDMLYHKGKGVNATFVQTDVCAGIRSRQEYCEEEDIDIIPRHCVPAQVLPSAGGMVIKRSIGPPLITLTTQPVTFWDHLRSLRGEWMWDNVQGGESDILYRGHRWLI
jgi:hypothetical protein